MNDIAPFEPSGTEFLKGGGELGALMRVHDWSTSPLGAPETWPYSLRSVVGLLLNSKFPMFVAWGKELSFLYNDAYAEILGTKHPRALGRRFQEIWAEIWSDISPLIDAAMAGEGTYRENLPLVMNRKGFNERTWFTFSYSPVRDESGQVAGMFCACTEMTAQVLAERRRDALLKLDDRLRDVADIADLSFAASELLGEALGASRVGYGAIDASAGTIVVERNWAAPGFDSVVGVYDFAKFGSYIDELRRGKAVANADIELDPRTAANAVAFRALGIRAHLDVPVFENGRTVGELFVHSPLPRGWTDEEIALVRDFAERTHAAIARRTAELELRASEMRFRTALEIETVGAIYFNMEGTLTDANDAFLRMSGYRREDLEAGRLTWRNLTPPEWMADSHRAFAELKATGRTAPREQEHTRKDGTRWWALFAAKLLPDGTGFEFVLDITERKLAEQRQLALVELSDRFRDTRDPDDLAYSAAEVLGRTLGVSRVGYATIDPDAETLHVRRDWNAPGVQSLAGVLQLRDYGSFIESLKRGEFISIPDVREDERTAAAAAALESRSARSFVNIPVIERGRLGAVLYVNHAAVRAWSGKELVLIREVAERTLTATERLRAEADLRHSEARLRELNDTLEAQVAARSAERDRLWNLSQDMLARADYSGMMSAASPAWTHILGWDEAELLTRGYATFMHPDDTAPTLEAIGRMAETRRPSRFENRIATRDGGWKHIEWTVAPEPDGVNFIAVGRDLSLTKAREIELEAAQEALRQSQKMEAMGSLTGGVAHDFNNLLTPIVGALDMLQRKGLGGEREQRLVSGAAQSAERAKVLVQRLLAFARRQPLQSVAVDVATLVRNMADLVSSTTGPQIKVVVDAEEDLPPAKADPNQLEMALLNLAVNARDAMPEGGTLRISASADTVAAGSNVKLRSGRYVRLSVADTGIGMDQATLARAVEPFFSTKGVGKGTGLGLSMVHGLVSQLGGALTIKSKLGLGTNVELWLPQTEAVPEATALMREAEPFQGSGTALLVDDEDIVRLSTADMLGSLGYRVVEAESAEEALRVISKGVHIDLVVTDHLMPGMTGTDLARALRDHRPDIPVLVVSGYAEVEGIAADLPRLTKPFREDELAASLAALSAERLR